MRQFGRVVAVEIGQPGQTGIRLEGLHIKATAIRGATGVPDTCAITMWGASDDTVKRLETPGSVTRLLAGYDGKPVQIAYGSMVRASLRVVKKGTGVVDTHDVVDHVTSWMIADGGEALRTVTASRVWAGQVQARTVINSLLGDAGLPSSITLGSEVAYTTGYVAFGGLANEFDILARDTGSAWTFQGGVLVMWPLNGQKRTVGARLTKTSGLIGSPRKTDKGVEIVCLLRPEIAPGIGYRVESRDYTGDLTCVNVTHDIDSGFEQPFTSTVLGVPRG